MLSELTIEMHAYRCSYEEHTVYFDVKFFQEVILEKDSSKSFIAPTWSSGGVVGIVGEETIQDIVSMLVHEFVTSYLSANPQDESNTGKVI